MDAEIQALQQELQAIREIVEADHKMIKSTYRRVRLASTFNVIKWVVIIGFSVGAFYYVQPLLESVLGTYTSLGGASSSNQSSLEVFKSLL